MSEAGWIGWAIGLVIALGIVLVFALPVWAAFLTGFALSLLGSFIGDGIEDRRDRNG